MAFVKHLSKTLGAVYNDMASPSEGSFDADAVFWREKGERA